MRLLASLICTRRIEIAATSLKGEVKSSLTGHGSFLDLRCSQGQARSTLIAHTENEDQILTNTVAHLL